MPKEIILQSELPEHRISALIYLHYNQTWEEIVNYSSNHMIQWCGYKTNWRRGTSENIFTKFRDSMQWLFKNGYLIDFDKDKYVQNTFQSSLLNKEKLLPKSNYGNIYDFEIKTIMEYESPYKPLNRSILLLLLSYIRAFTWIRKTEISGHSEKSKKAKPEIFYSQFEIIGEHLGISPRMISRATTVLEELGLITTYRMPSYKNKDDEWRTNDIIYLCPYRLIWDKKINNFRLCSKEEYNWQNELSYGIKYLNEYKYSDKKFYQD